MNDFGEFERLLEAALRERPTPRLAEALARGSWIYGAGLYGTRIGALLQVNSYPLAGFIDRRAGGAFSQHLGAPVVHPADFTAEMARGRTCVAAVVNSQPAANDVVPWAQALPFADILKGADLPDVLGPQADSFWLSSRAGMAENLHRLRSLADRLADRRSVEAFVGALKFRATGETRYLQAADEPNQYIPPDLPGFDRPITFVDGGAYDGDSCASLKAHGVEIVRYIAFEPDAGNFARLSRYAAKSGANADDLYLYGLSDRAHEVSFADGQGVCSHVADGGGGTTTIRCVALDVLMPDLDADYIKLDIEGSELAALNGMAHLVETRRPRLAVCLYHKPQDIWEIPEWVCRRYERFHVRQHGGFGFDLVAYALPPG